MSIRDVRELTTLSSKTRVRADWNYNKTAASITRPGDIIMYQAPGDPAAHPLYVDAEGRPVPVDPNTLQIMLNDTHHVVDSTGANVLPYEFTSASNSTVHEDDIRVAVASRDLLITDQNDEEVMVSPDGTLIPLNDDKVPNVVMIEGVPWALDALGQPVAPLERVIPLGSYRRPVEASNVPMDKSYKVLEQDPGLFDEYFPIESIAYPHRPRRRGALKAWAADEGNQVSSYVGNGTYQQGRFYTASEESKYKYWTPTETADKEGTLDTPVNITMNDSSWITHGVTSTNNTTTQFSGNFNNTLSTNPYIAREFSLEQATSYSLDFTIVAQSATFVNVYIEEYTSGFNYQGMNKNVRLLKTYFPGADVVLPVSLKFTTGTSSSYSRIKFEVARARTVPNPRVSFSDMSIARTHYAISHAGPRVTYDRPLPANKIRIGVDYTLDERHDESVSNMPSDNSIRVLADRGDGVMEWITVAEDIYPDIDGFIEVYLQADGTWGDEPDWDATNTVNISTVQFNVWGMNISGARLNIMEISLHRIMDLSDRFVSYDTDFNVSNDDFVLPFGTVSSNVSSVALSNYDGMFSNDNPFLLDTERFSAGESVFTNTPNPLYRLLAGEIDFTVDTAVFDPDQQDVTEFDYEWIRMLTMAGSAPTTEGEMVVTFNLKDSSRILQQTQPNSLFFVNHSGMSVVQVLYMLLDSVGFTSVEFDPHDQFEATHMEYYWTNTEGTVWDALENVCMSTQITAYFDEHDNLRFRSLKALYDDALNQSPKEVLTTDDVGEHLSNIVTIDDTETMQTNKVNVVYKELKPSAVSDSGVAKMEAIWEPEGDVVLRAQSLRRELPGNSDGAQSISVPVGSTATWPWEGMVNIEGEMIKYHGQQYQFYDANGVKRYKYIYTNEERLKLDKLNVDLAYQNQYTGRLLVTERGAEDTLVRPHTLGSFSGYDRYLKSPGRTKQKFSIGKFKDSKLELAFPPSSSFVSAASYNMMVRGSMNDLPPRFFGTRLAIKRGTHFAGMGIALNSNLDGIFVELSTTEQIENINRPRNELTIYIQKSNKRTLVGEDPKGIVLPIVTDKFYDLEITYTDGVRRRRTPLYSAYTHLTVKMGTRGQVVKVLQQGLNRDWKEKLAVDGVAGTKTIEAIKRMQRKSGIPVTGVMNKASWEAAGGYAIDSNSVSVHVWVDGVNSHSAVIEKSQLPKNPDNTGGYDGGHYGLFTRASTTAEFEYLYAIRGSEELIDDGDNGLMSKITGSYFSDQINNQFFYTKKNRHLIRGGKKVVRNAINNQFFFDDFGAYVHEVRDYDIEFADLDRPAEYSNLYLSNDQGATIVEYRHRPLSAKFRIANTARHDAILNGDDGVTFGPDNRVDQHMLIYGRVLDSDFERSLTIEDKNSTRSNGIHEVSIDVDWIQNAESAKKLGSHIVEAMGHQTRKFAMNVFGNPYLKVGDMISIYAPQHGVNLDGTSPDTVEELYAANRFVITQVSHANDGSHTTDINARQLIDRTGFRHVRLSDILKGNNNNMLRNQYLDEFDIVQANRLRILVPKNINPSRYTSLRTSFDGGADGYMHVQGTQGTTPPNVRDVGFTPDNILLESGDRPAHTIGDYYMWTAEVTAITDCTVVMQIGGYQSSGYSMPLAENRRRLKKGQKARLVLTGQYLDNGSVPEALPGLYLLDYDGNPATSKQHIKVHDIFYRSSNSSNAIYPDSGFVTLRRP